VGCAATFGAYNDDTGGLQSQVTLNGLLAGDSVLIQVGSYSAVTQGAGTLNIAQYIDPCGATAVDDGLEDNDTCATAYVMAPGVYTNLWLSDTDPDNYEITIPAGDILTVILTLNSGDIDFNVYDATCTLLGTIAGSFTYTNVTGLPETIVVEAVNYAFSAATCAEYDLDVSTAPDPCQATPDDAFEDNDDCANATPITDGTYPGLFIINGDKDNFSTCVADGATIQVDILFSDALGDTDLFLWDAADIDCGGGYIFPITNLGYGYSVTDNETVSWTNTTGADVNVVIEVNIDFGDCNSYDLVVSGSGCGPVSAGTPFCDPADVNSTGGPTVLTGMFGSGVGSGLHLEMTNGPAGQLAYMLVGNQATAGFPLSNGHLCLVGAPGASFYRYNLAGTASSSIGGFNPAGVWINAAGTSTTGFGFDVPSTIPTAVPTPIMAGDTWHFQGWYRDTAAAVGSSNFSNGLSVTF
jgi:hypothetical protein